MCLVPVMSPIQTCCYINLILLFALIIPITQAKAFESQVTQDLSIRMVFQELTLISDKRLAAKRHACAFHKMGDVKAGIEARGTPFPDVTRYCLAVLREAGRRGALPQLYGLLEPLGKADPWGRIFDAASQNKESYVSASGKVHRIPCPLAFDAGYSAGYIQPDKRSPFETINVDRIEKMTAACFDPGIETETLRIGTTSATSAYLGFVAGFSRGQRDSKAK